MEIGQTWLEGSLGRSAKLGLEVLERARRRSMVEWPSVCPVAQLTVEETLRRHSGEDRVGKSDNEEATRHTSIDDAFDTVLEFMAHTTKQCKTQRTSEDFYIELAPGTYAITAGACDSERQTRVVKINAGESVDLSFAV
ncbi:uncharacterized protein LOC121330087 isoform X2 [Polyodon spathula]|uniref:uncharacterized protein LOC121330087 isoform X2 n=1 Tax=Polyodon spathula TaxID=7913 RepID=UPI001B7E2E01|nr:uncharacterized protein LOC121330087 isoform X2 [Polyodon spathula]